jgi:hypothetical protein
MSGSDDFTIPGSNGDLEVLRGKDRHKQALLCQQEAGSPHPGTGSTIESLNSVGSGEEEGSGYLPSGAWKKDP